MSTCVYEEQHRRLRLAGACVEAEAPRLRDTVLSLAGTSPTLIVDLTAVTEMPADVADALVTAQQVARPCRVALVRKHGTLVDARLQDAQPDGSDPKL